MAATTASATMERMPHNRAKCDRSRPEMPHAPQSTGMYEWIVQIVTRKLKVPVKGPHHSRMVS